MTDDKLTPFEEHGGLWMKREDHHRLPNGVNGAKLRACQYLIARAKQRGATTVISAASLLSPQNPMAATVAQQLGMKCLVIVGGTTPQSAARHTSFQIAAAAGAEFRFTGVGYNPALQSAARKLHAATPDSYWLQYGITPPPEAHAAEIRGFHDTAATQVQNLPGSVTTLVVPFGSGNTGAGVLWGLARTRWKGTVQLLAIGPSRQQWLTERLRLLGCDRTMLPYTLRLLDLHGRGFAKYGDRMAETLNGVVLHPTYEGKVARFLNETQPSWWRRTDGTTALWIVGGPLPRRAGAAS